MAQQIRAELADLSMLQISKRTGLPYAVVHGFMTNASDVRTSTLEKLANLAGLQLVKRKERK